MVIVERGDILQNDDGSVRVSRETGGCTFIPSGRLAVHVQVDGTDFSSAHVGIYGEPEGLLQLADLLTAIALLDQSKIRDRNCPPDEGMHTTLQPGSQLTGRSVSLNIGRFDAKATKDTRWFLSHPQVVVAPSQ